MKINLLPQEYRPQAAINIPRLGLAITFGVLIFAAVILVVNDWFTLSQLKINLENTNKGLELYGQQYKNVKFVEQLQNDIQKRRQEIKEVVKPYKQINDLLGVVTQPLPDNLWLTNVGIDSQNHVIIEGKTSHVNAVALYVMDLESSNVIENTKVQNINEVKNEGMGDLYEFSLSFQLEKAGVKDGQY